MIAGGDEDGVQFGIVEHPPQILDRRRHVGLLFFNTGGDLLQPPFEAGLVHVADVRELGVFGLQDGGGMGQPASESDHTAGELFARAFGLSRAGMHPVGKHRGGGKSRSLQELATIQHSHHGDLKGVQREDA